MLMDALLWYHMQTNKHAGGKIIATAERPSYAHKLYSLAGLAEVGKEEVK